MGHDAVVQRLLEAKADVNQAAFGGGTPLHTAAETGHDAVVQRLLEAKADVNQAANDGATPLHVAARFGRKKVITKLLAAKANIHTVMDDGRTPLDLATHHGHHRVARLLERAGARGSSSFTTRAALAVIFGAIIAALVLFPASRKRLQTTISHIRRRMHARAPPAEWLDETEDKLPNADAAGRQGQKSKAKRGNQKRAQRDAKKKAKKKGATKSGAKAAAARELSPVRSGSEPGSSHPAPPPSSSSSNGTSLRRRHRPQPATMALGEVRESTQADHNLEPTKEDEKLPSGGGTGTTTTTTTITTRKEGTALIIHDGGTARRGMASLITRHPLVANPPPTRAAHSAGGHDHDDGADARVASRAVLAAARAGKASQLRELLALREADPNEGDGDGTTPIMAAASGGHHKCISILLAADVDLTATDDHGWDCLFHASFACGKGTARLPDDAHSGRKRIEQYHGLVRLLKSDRVEQDALLRAAMALTAVSSALDDGDASIMGLAPGAIAVLEGMVEVALPLIDAQARGEWRWCGYCLCVDLTHDMARCAGCRSIAYCSQECLELHWKAKPVGHKVKCKQHQKAAKAAKATERRRAADVRRTALAGAEEAGPGETSRQRDKDDCGLRGGAQPELRCPITDEVFADPVTATDGHTYERAAIEEWFGRGKITSPMTGGELPSTVLVPSHAVRQLVARQREATGLA